MWPDNETVDDLIGFRVHADLIAEVVADQKLLPVTIGVFGDWGNGKTSIMKMLEAKLGENDDIAVLYFDAWLFEGYDDAKSALISSILKQLAGHKRFPDALKDQAAKLIGRVNWMRVMKMGWDNVALPAVLAYATGGATAIPGFMGALKGLFSSQATPSAAEAVTSENMEGLLKPSDESEITEVRDFREAFGALLKKTDFKALVVLIDDLDRCSPERIVENLEAIKLFLNVGNTAFVIGADPRIVRHAIAVRYRDSLDAAKAAAEPSSQIEASAQLVRDYVEKLIQIPYHLPRLSPAEIETYMTLLFAQRDLSPEHFRICVAACEEQRLSNRFSTFGLAAVAAALKGEALPKELKESLSFTAGAAPMFTENLKGNPRQVKRFLNAFTLRRKLSKVARMDSLQDAVLLKLMLLEYSADERFKELAGWHQAQNETPKEIVAMEAGGEIPKGWERDSLKRWIEMEPKLTGIDLSDYFWLVRDRLDSSLLGLTLVPPVVRTAYDALLTEMGRKIAPSMLKELRDDEIDSLFGLLSKHIQRDSEEVNGYRALFKLAESRHETMQRAVDLIQQLPPENLPPALSPQLTVLATSNPPLKSLADGLVDYLSKQGGRTAKAANIEKK